MQTEDQEGEMNKFMGMWEKRNGQLKWSLVARIRTSWKNYFVTSVNNKRLLSLSESQCESQCDVTQ